MAEDEKKTGAQILVDELADLGVKYVFGYPGGSNLPIFNVINKTKLEMVLNGDERCAGHAAEGYARATGEVGVVLVTSGPGATNLVTPLADAKMDSTPILGISGQVYSHLIGRDAFQGAVAGERPSPFEQAPQMGNRSGQIFQPLWIATSPPRIGSKALRVKPAAAIICRNASGLGKRRIDSTK